MGMEEYRQHINEIDEQIVKLYKERLAVADEIALYKKANGMQVRDAARERQLMERIAEMAGEEDENAVRCLYSLMLELSRARQNGVVSGPTELAKRMDDALASTQPLFPEKAVVAVQGTDGAYSQQAAQKLFKYPSLMFFNSFDKVFSAVDKGLCRYGILPLENSTAGSVNQIYDAMFKYNFSIVRTARIQVSHVLAAPHGVKLADVKDIYSHEQAIWQSNRFLGTLSGVKVVPCENTAIAAQRVKDSGRKDMAAICSMDCADIHGLNVLASNVCDNSNYTRFICISKKPEIYPGADKTSIMMVLPHRAGSLYKVLSRLNVMGINLNKLESRPLPDRNFEFMFYFDIEESIYSPSLKRLLCELEQEAVEFRYLGSYSEVM